VDSGALDTLVARARAAQRSVSELPLGERLERARRAGEAIAAAGEDIVAHAVAEARQPVRFARRELTTALGFVAALPALAEEIRPRRVPAVSGETTLEWAPYGVVLGWHAANSPVWVPTLVALSALVGGNTAVCRPSSRVPRTSSRVLEAIAGEWLEDAVQVAALSRDEAEPLVWHEGVDAVVAHASSETCKRHLALLGEAYARGARLRPYIPEGSGNDAFVVLAGAAPERVAAALATAAFANSGQLCMAAKRVIVLEELWPALRGPLSEAVAALRVGPPEREDTDVAPLGPGRALERGRADLAEALAAGGRIVAGGGERDGVLTPTVVELAREDRDVRLWREESFGPVRSLVLARDEDEAVALANETRFGLGAAVFGGGEGVAARLRGARIVVEEGPLYQDPHLVVGGVGDSGLGGARPKLEQLVYARRVHRGGGG
jgi:acyl-CoA reductase-like NAD-dependent aldehyde dehydrogenase